MSFVRFFYAALGDANGPNPEQVAQLVVAGHRLAEAIEAGLRTRFASDAQSLREAVAYSFLATAASEPSRALFHIAKYLALNGEFVGAGQLLSAHQRSNASLDLAKARKQARAAAMRATKAFQTAKWKTAVKKVGDRLRSKEGWPISDVQLARKIRASREISTLPEKLRPAESTVRAAIRELGLDAKSRRAAIKRQNASRANHQRKKAA